MSDGSWVHIGADTLPRRLLLPSVLTLVTTLGFAGLIALFDGALSASIHPFLSSLVVGLPLFAALYAGALLRDVRRGVSVDPVMRRLRVGRRVVPFSQVRRAWRLPAPADSGEVWVRLSIDSGPDALIPLTLGGVPALDATRSELVLELIGMLPLEIEPGAPLRPPHGDELGVPDAALAVFYAVGERMLAHTETSYAKETLWHEARVSLALARRAEGLPTVPGDEVLPASVMPDPETWAFAESGVPGPAIPPGVGGVPGPARSLGAEYVGRLGLVAGWLQAVQGSTPAPSQRPWSLAGGWTVVLSIAGPWIAFVVAVVALGTAAGTPPVWPIFLFAFLFFFWPIGLWAGLLLQWRGRLARYRRARAAVVAVVARGLRVPPTVSAFFAPSSRDTQYRRHLSGLLGVIGSILLLLGLGTFAGVALSMPGAIVFADPALPTALFELIGAVGAFAAIGAARRRAAVEIALGRAEHEVMTLRGHAG
jgi:hypothetical protein